VPDYLAALDPNALNGARIGVVNNSEVNYQAAIATIQALGATAVPIPTPTATPTPQILFYEFKRDLNSYLAHLGPGAPMDSLADVIAFNEAHPREAIKFGQTILIASQALDVSPGSADTAAYLTNLVNGKSATRTALDAAYTRGTADPRRRPRCHLHAGRRADRHRRPRRVSAADRAGRLLDGQPPRGQRVLQRPRLQRGAAARVRLCVRAGDEAAPARNRPQPVPLREDPAAQHLRRPRRVRARARTAREDRPPAQAAVRDRDRVGAEPRAAHGRGR
jgi:hypothetical protein